MTILRKPLLTPWRREGAAGQECRQRSFAGTLRKGTRAVREDRLEGPCRARKVGRRRRPSLPSLDGDRERM